MTDWTAITAELAKPLDRRYVRPPPQGKYGEYVDAHHVVSEANRIFGFNGWCYTVSTIQQTNNAESDGKHHVGYYAVVRVTVDGITREDAGHGQGHGKSLGDAHDSAVKEAVTDGLKRALRTFGNPFGLALYDKTQEHVRDVGADARAADEDQAKLSNAQSLEELKTAFEAIFRSWGRDSAGHSRVPQAIIEAKDRRKAELQDLDRRKQAARDAAGPAAETLYADHEDFQ